MRSGSPAPSVLSITSSLRAQIYRQEYGRNINNYSELYRLPADQEELDRLERQHRVFADMMKDKYPPPFAEIMRDDIPGERKACLDLGCGSGGWITDVALEFPNCNAVAVDLVPMQARLMPPNLRSEIDDINLGLEHFFGDFNVVHARLISSGIKDYYRLIDQISRVLRPGGLIDVSEFDFTTYDINHQRIVMDEQRLGHPWWSRWLRHLRTAIQTVGGEVDAATHLHSWVLGHPTFEDVVYKEFWLPIIAPESKKFEDNLLAFLKSGRPLLLGSGLSEEIVAEIESNVIEEMHSKDTTQFSRLQCVYARKKQV